MTFLFPSWATEAKEALRRTEAHVYVHLHTCEINKNTANSYIVEAAEGHSVPASQQWRVCVLWWRMFGRGLVLGLMGGLKAWLRSLPLSLSLSALPPSAVLLP